MLDKAETLPLAQMTPREVYTDGGLAKVVSEIRKRAFEAIEGLDATKGGDRAKIVSTAYLVRRSKTAIDDAGKEIKAEAQRIVNATDAIRREARDKLDALTDEVRKPATAWEQAEEARQKKIAESFAAIDALPRIAFGATSTDIAVRLRLADEHPEITDDEWGERAEEARRSLNGARERLREMHQQARAHEEQAAEIARLRKEAEERERAEQERIASEQRAREEAERKERDAHDAEARRQREEEERQRREFERKEAEERAKKAAAEAAERAAREAAERERQRIEEEKSREEAERRRREENKRIRSRVLRTIVEDVAKVGGLKSEQAVAVADALADGRIRHVAVTF